MINSLPTTKARHHCLQLQQDLDTHKCLDFAGERAVSTDYLFGPAKGMMFGILVCTDSDGNEVVLKAFSGQYNGQWEVPGWVLPALDRTEYQKIVDASATAILNLSHAIEGGNTELLAQRKELSQNTQREVNTLYRFHCIDGTITTIKKIFGTKLPPTGTGDCCAPKLLNHAFKYGLTPISMAEFFYGSTTQYKMHKEFYSPCEERCKPLLTHMLGLEIVYRDADIVVVNKPSGLLSVPGRGADKQDCIVARLKRLFPACMEQPAVHRLDRDTSGLLVLAFTPEAHRNLSIQFIQRRVHKRYIALVEGVIKEEEGEITLAFRYDPDNKPRQKYDPVLGKWGTTFWKKIRVEPLGSKERLVTRLEFNPLTGRTHQLRVHSAHKHGLGHPIVGDKLYGDEDSGERLMLQANLLEFTHPLDNKVMQFSLAPDF